MTIDHRKKQREIEFKLAVKDKHSFEAIAEKTRGRLRPAARQVNYFFDTPDKDLDREWYTLRLRDEEGHFTVTAKRPRQKNLGSASRDRDEAEVELETSLAKKILACQHMPFTALKELSEASRFLDDMESVIGGKRQTLSGSFENERSKMGPVELEAGGQSIELTFEMDRTTFPGDQVQYEIEVEVSEAMRDLAEKALRALWKELRIEWIDDTPSKFKRFKDASKGKSIG